MTTVEQQPRAGLVRIGIALVLFHAFFLLFVYASGSLLPGFFKHESYYGNFHWPRNQPPTLSTRFATWDAQHYLYLATEGYAAGQRSITFFPLFPWLIRAASVVPGVSPFAAALALANVLAIAGALLLHRLLATRHPGAGDDTLLLLLASPGALFFHFPYTESLFLLLAVAALAAIDRKRWPIAAAAGFLLALTRPNGVLIVVVLAYAALSRWRVERCIPRGALLALAGPILGLGAYLAFMRVSTGAAMAGFDMQAAYNAGRSLGSLLDPLAVLRELADAWAIHSALGSFIDRAVFVLALATLIPLWRFDRLLFWYALPMALVGPLSGSFMSYTRFAAVLFPCHLAAARLLAGERARPFLWLALAGAYSVQVLLLLRHISFRWAG